MIAGAGLPKSLSANRAGGLAAATHYFMCVHRYNCTPDMEKAMNMMKTWMLAGVLSALCVVPAAAEEKTAEAGAAEAVSMEAFAGSFFEGAADAGDTVMTRDEPGQSSAHAEASFADAARKLLLDTFGQDLPADLDFTEMAAEDASEEAADGLFYECQAGRGQGGFLLMGNRAAADVRLEGRRAQFRMSLVGGAQLGGLDGLAYKVDNQAAWWFFGIEQANGYFPVALSVDNRNFAVFCGAAARRVNVNTPS